MKRAVLGVVLGGLVGMWLWLPLPHSTTAIDRSIKIQAEAFAYSPGRVQVNQGDRVTIILTSTDVVHGFHLDGYEVDRRITPGIEERIEFTAEQTGKFRYRCSVSCGSLHPFMVGELIVSPNNPFIKATGTVLMALMGMFVFLWKFGRTIPYE